jgi:hypothetical protein
MIGGRQNQVTDATFNETTTKLQFRVIMSTNERA